MILVTGATGNVGRHVVSQLQDAGAAVRALTRDTGTARLPEGVDVVRGDLFAPGPLAPALDGVEAVFLLWPVPTADGASEVVDVIAKHARRVVFLSAMSVPDDDEQADPIFHTHIERAIRRSGLEWTFLRAGGFASNTLIWASQVRGGVVRWPYGAAARSLIHERDIAAVAVRALTEDGHAGAAYVLTGPETVTQADQVRIIGEAIGRTVRWEDISPGVAREQMLADGWPPAFADHALGYWATLESNPEPVTTTVEEIIGVPARTFRDWAIDHADDFRPATTAQMAEAYVALCRQGKFGDPSMERLFSADHVRLEPVDGKPVETRGSEITANSRRFIEGNHIHGVEIDGPFTGGDRFAVRFAIDTTAKATGERATITKVSLYTVADGKITREEVYYNAQPPGE
jgi:uncharacterized protein YbjT (DUF2867 family)